MQLVSWVAPPFSKCYSLPGKVLGSLMLWKSHSTGAEWQSWGYVPGSSSAPASGLGEVACQSETQPAANCVGGFPHPHPTCPHVGGELVTKCGTCLPALGFQI